VERKLKRCEEKTAGPGNQRGGGMTEERKEWGNKEKKESEIFLNYKSREGKGVD